MSITIRSERPGEALAIERLTVEAFRAAPHSSGTESFIVQALRDANRLSISLVAEDDEGIVGHVALSPVSISDGARNWFGLGPISVLPARQGQGIGSQVMVHALAELRRRGAAGCVLLGDPGYYGRFGFKAEAALVLPGVPPQYFQALAFGSSMPSGTVAYDEAFNAPAP